VIIGATADGKKELVGLADGIRESAQSWKEWLLDLKRRGLTARLLEGDRRGVAEDTSATLLDAQNRECLEQAAQEPAGQGQARVAEHLDGGDQARRRGCLGDVHRIVWHQVRQGRRVPDQRPRGAVRFLRLPRRALETSTHDKPDRKYVRHRAASNGPIEELPLEQDRHRHDLQAHTSRREKLESSPRLQPVAESYPRCKVQRWNRGRQIASSSRCRLTPLVTKIRR
jgi:hypothetical protein